MKAIEDLPFARSQLTEPLLRCIAQNKRGYDGSELIGHSVRFTVQEPGSAVFNCLRNLGCLAHWWPRALAVKPLPPGVFGIGDIGLLELTRETAWFRVMAYVPGRRIVLALVLAHDLLIVDLRVLGSHEACSVELRIEAPRHRATLTNLWQALWLRMLCNRAAVALQGHLRSSSTSLNGTTRFEQFLRT
jgi:hypothetical protein